MDGREMEGLLVLVPSTRSLVGPCGFSIIHIPSFQSSRSRTGEKFRTNENVPGLPARLAARRAEPKPEPECKPDLASRVLVCLSTAS